MNTFDPDGSPREQNGITRYFSLWIFVDWFMSSVCELHYPQAEKRILFSIGAGCFLVGLLALTLIHGSIQ